LLAVHNVVTSNQHPNRQLFPSQDVLRIYGSTLKLNGSIFQIPWGSSRQLRLSSLSDLDRASIIAALDGRWLIEGGIDQSLIDTAPSSSALLLRVLTAAESCFRDNVEDSVVLNVEMFVMALCPFCASKMHKIADQIACDVDCSQHTDGKLQSVGLDFQVHYVGIINNDTSIAAVHGSVEVKLIL
jgi:hypothetical protein